MSALVEQRDLGDAHGLGGLIVFAYTANANQGPHVPLADNWIGLITVYDPANAEEVCDQNTWPSGTRRPTMHVRRCGSATVHLPRGLARDR